MESDELGKELAQLHKSAFGWAMVCCGRNRDLAAEVLQQAYCRILTGDASFAGKSKFSTWVFGVIRHVALEEFRHQQRQRRLIQSNAQIADQASAVVDSDHVTIEHRELAEQLSSALEKLSGRQREVLHLTFYENMTLEQAANIMNITVGSARQHYQRGKASLHRILTARREVER
jgi:RNA polymerase sigma factor (sigma-70 family)